LLMATASKLGPRAAASPADRFASCSSMFSALATYDSALRGSPIRIATRAPFTQRSMSCW